jgi:hypothetical protein
MKTEKSFPEIDDLLRSQQPDSLPPPDLEGRILRALDQRKRPAPKPWWPWLLLPPAFAAVVLIMWPRPGVPVPNISVRDQPVSAGTRTFDPVVSIVESADPLTAETTALTRDVKRAGDFLIGCLPSIASQTE